MKIIGFLVGTQFWSIENNQHLQKAIDKAKPEAELILYEREDNRDNDVTFSIVKKKNITTITNKNKDQYVEFLL